MALDTSQPIRFGVGRFRDPDIANAPRRRSQKQWEIRSTRAFSKAKVFGKLSPCMSLGHEIQEERRPAAAISIFEINRKTDGQGSMVADRLSGRKLRRCHSDEIVEIVIDDGCALETGRIVLEFQRRCVVPLTIKMGLER
ncbi:hypothetical protein GCM10023069_72330 [Shinella granuli]